MRQAMCLLLKQGVVSQNLSETLQVGPFFNWQRTKTTQHDTGSGVSSTDVNKPQGQTLLLLARVSERCNTSSHFI